MCEGVNANAASVAANSIQRQVQPQAAPTSRATAEPTMTTNRLIETNASGAEVQPLGVTDVWASLFWGLFDNSS